MKLFEEIKLWEDIASVDETNFAEDEASQNIECCKSCEHRYECDIYDEVVYPIEDAIEEAQLNNKTKEIIGELIININKALNSFKCSRYQYDND